MPLTLRRRPHLLIVGEVHGQATRSVQNNHLVSPADRAAAMLAPMAPAPPVITATRRTGSVMPARR